jgi:GNAT superfamily N-acetyltransferase
LAIFVDMKPQEQTEDWDIGSEMSFAPLSRGNWGKFTELFGERGACGNCWCMYFRLRPQEFVDGKTDGGNKQKMHDLVLAGKPTGLLGFHEGKPIGWCSFAPREDFRKIEASRVHKRIDDRKVWSVTCFFIDKSYRRSGVSVAMLKGLIAYARQEGIGVIEAYPTIPTKEPLPDSFAWIGLYKSFERAGFEVVDRTSKHRPMVRYYTDKQGR